MANSKYENLRESLEKKGTGEMTVFGQSMMPILHSGSTLTYVQQDGYGIGDVVFAKVKGRYIDAHMITKVRADGKYMIANNHGFENGWASEVYGKVVKATHKGETKDL